MVTCRAAYDNTESVSPIVGFESIMCSLCLQRRLASWHRMGHGRQTLRVSPKANSHPLDLGHVMSIGYRTG